MTTLWGGFAVFARDCHLFFAGDTGYSRDLGAKRSLGVHWGTFELTDEPLDEPPRALSAVRRAQGLSEEEFFVMAIGETRMIVPRDGIPRRGDRFEPVSRGVSDFR